MMRYSRIKQMGLVAVLALSAAASSHPAAQATYLLHGLRACIDPATGQFIRPDSLAETTSAAGLFAAATRRVTTIPIPLEVRSVRAGGGYTVDLQDRFRLSRRGARNRKAGS